MDATQIFAQENLNLLQQHHPDAAKGLLYYLQEQRKRGEFPKYQTVICPSGQLSLVKQVDGKTVYLHDKIHPKNKAIEDIKKNVTGQMGLVILFSSGLGYAPCALEIFLRTRKIILVEPDYDILFLALQTCDWREALKSSNLHILAGDDAIETVKKTLKNHGSLLKNDYQIIAGRNLFENEQKIILELKNIADKSHASFIKTSLLKKESLKQDASTYCIATSEVHKELSVTLSEQARQVNLAIREIKRRSAITSLMGSDIPIWETVGYPLPKSLLAFSPNVFQDIEWERIKDHGIERLLWFYDDPFRFDLKDSFLSDLDRIYCFDPILAMELGKRLDKPVQYLAAAATFSHGLQGPAPSNPPAEMDITFVGSTGLQRFDERFLKWLSNKNPPMQAFENLICERIRKSEIFQYDEIKQLKPPISGLPEPARLALIEDLTTFYIRNEYLKALMNKPLSIYGDAGWTMKALVGPLTGLYSGRSLDFMHETPWIYNRSKINLNIFNVQCMNSPTIRMFDVMACGGFLLTEYRPFIEERYKIGEELDVFRDPKELAEKTDYYLAHPDQRMEIAKAGQAKTLREDIYSERLPIIFENSS